MREKDGGAAFPTAGYLWGMSLRDYFAAQAMAAYLTSPVTSPDATNDAERCSEWAYIQADAMLKERAK